MTQPNEPARPPHSTWLWKAWFALGLGWELRYSDATRALIAGLVLDDYQRQVLVTDWLEEIERFDRAAWLNKWLHNALRVGAIIGGAFVSFSVAGGTDVTKVGATTVGLSSAFTVSLLVSLALAIDAYFRFGDRYQRSRFTAEVLRIEGSKFFGLASPYLGSHRDSVPLFVGNVAAELKDDIRAWISFATERQEAAPPKRDGDPGPKAGATPPSPAPPAGSKGQP
jgi:hypothetical protein